MSINSFTSTVGEENSMDIDVTATDPMDCEQAIVSETMDNMLEEIDLGDDIQCVVDDLLDAVETSEMDSKDHLVQGDYDDELEDSRQALEQLVSIVADVENRLDKVVDDIEELHKVDYLSKTMPNLASGRKRKRPIFPGCLFLLVSLSDTNAV